MFKYTVFDITNFSSNLSKCTYQKQLVTCVDLIPASVISPGTNSLVVCSLHVVGDIVNNNN